MPVAATVWANPLLPQGRRLFTVCRLGAERPFLPLQDHVPIYDVRAESLAELVDALHVIEKYREPRPTDAYQPLSLYQLRNARHYLHPGTNGASCIRLRSPTSPVTQEKVTRLLTMNPLPYALQVWTHPGAEIGRRAFYVMPRAYGPTKRPMPPGWEPYELKADSLEALVKKVYQAEAYPPETPNDAYVTLSYKWMDRPELYVLRARGAVCSVRLRLPATAQGLKKLTALLTVA